MKKISTSSSIFYTVPLMGTEFLVYNPMAVRSSGELHHTMYNTEYKKCLIYEYKNSRHAIKAIKNICTVFRVNIVRFRKCQKLFSKFQ